MPESVSTFLALPNPAIVATLRADGSPHTAATWYDWDGTRVLLNMAETRLRLAHVRHDPRVALTVLDAESWYRHVSLLGRVTSIADDVDLLDIDRLARRYTGAAYHDRGGRRVSAWVEIDRWHGWSGGQPWSG